MIFLRSYWVLKDCEIALRLLEEERDTDTWRVHWVGAIALIRAVGHVLRHTDRHEYPEFASKIDASFASWRTGDEHLIFREFIDQERNNVLKEYRSSINDLPCVRVVVTGRPGQSPIMWKTNDEGGQIPLYELDENLFRPRLDGFRAGEDARDIYREGLGWWEAELRKIVS